MPDFVQYRMDKLVQGDKYIMQEIQLSDYAVLMNLTIRELSKKDFGGYVCSSVNVLGKAEGNIRLQGERKCVDAARLLVCGSLPVKCVKFPAGTC